MTIDPALAGMAGRGLVWIILIVTPIWFAIRRFRDRGQDTIEQEQEERRSIAAHAPVWPMGPVHGE